MVRPELLLEVRNLTKRFPLVVANEAIDFDVRKGEIHCLLGENGAGKTTLAECLYGYYQPDSGEIRHKGEKVVISSPSEAIKLGIGMVHQHFMLVEPNSVLDNIILGTEQKGMIVNYQQALEKIKGLCSQYNVTLNPHAKIWQLSVGEQQWVEILKALYVKAELLIMDEPTAMLTPQESDHLFAVLQQMKQQGLSIVFITHNLNEVMAVSDRITILRKGKKIDTVNTRDSSKKELAKMMVGREVIFDIDKPGVNPGRSLLAIKNLQAKNDLRQLALRGIDLTVHEGEVVGIAGVAGNGQKELMEVLVGVRRAENGTVSMLGKNSLGLSTRQIMNLGVGHIPSDRIKQGLILEFSVSENMILGKEWEQPYRRGLVLDEKAVQDFTRDGISIYEIDTPSERHRAQYLSGGNLQKIILARELAKTPKLLLADQPCRGLDIGVIEYVHQRLLKLRSEGVGILLISEDLDELFTLSDRLLVIFKGQILGQFLTQEAERAQVGLLMAGCTEDQW
jgi:simple sugar transport system ATP-binding protein